MISISKTQFAVLGFVFVALMLIPVNDAFADHTTSITLETRTDGGTEAQFEVHGNGIYDVFDEIKVWIDKDNFNSNSEIFKQFSTPFNDNQFPIEVLKVNDGYYMIFVSIDNLSDGEHKVKIDAIQTRHGSTRTLDGGDGISLIVGNPTPTLTITNLSHYNCDSPAPPNHNQNWCNGTDHYRIDVDGSTTGFAPSQPLTFKIIDSNGNTVRDYSSFYGTQSGPPGFGYEGPVFYDSTFTEQYNGGFTVTICAPEFDVCDAESFTINSIVEDTPADTTPPVITVPSDQTFTTTDPAGYVYDFSVSATDNVAIDTTGTSNAGPGIFCVDWIPNPTPPGTLFPVGAGDSNHVVCSATDTSGNYGQATFIVTVIYEAAADTTPLVISTAMGIAGLDFPMSVAVDDSGNIYVADVGSDTIKKFDSYHNLIFTISNLNNPFDVAVDSSSNIYVAEQGSGCIKRYNSDGSVWGGIGCFSSTLHSMSIKNDQLYLTTNPYESSGDVVKMSLTGNSVNTFVQMSGPNGIAVDDLGNVYVVKSNDGSGSNWNPEGVIVKYDSSGNMISTIGDGYTSPISNPPNGQSLEQNLGKFTTGYGIEVDSSGKIYHADHHNKRVTIFDSSGNVLKWITTMPVSDIGGTPSADKSFGRINDVTVDSVGNIYVADGMDNGRIVILPSIAAMPEMFANPNQVICDFNDPFYSTTCADTTPPVLSLGSLTGTSDWSGASIFDLRDVMKTEITATDAGGISTIPSPYSIMSTFPNGNYSDQIKDDGNPGMVWCDNSQYWGFAPVSIIALPVGETTIKCAAWDNSENSTIESFTLVVNEPADTTPPTPTSQSYTVLVNEMRGSVAANDPGGCASFNPQTCYTPSDITINVGDSVTWVNNDSTNNWYTLMGNWGSLASSSGDNACDGPGKLALDMCGVSGNDRTSWTHTFDAVGTYNYYDWVYQNSAQRPEGVVNVVASGAPTPVTPTTPIQTADHTITTVAESGFSQDCVDTGCYTPSTLTVDVGDLINMTNTDPTGVHTFTSGTVDGFASNPNGIFDSDVLMSGDSFAWTPQTDTDQPYYCMLHTWMIGTIVVGNVDVVETPSDNSVTTTSSNGFTIQYTDTHYRITQFENDHLYGWSLTHDGNPSSSGTNRLDQSNTNNWYDHRTSNGNSGDYVTTWYYDYDEWYQDRSTIPLATVSYTVDYTVPENPAPQIINNLEIYEQSISAYLNSTSPTGRTISVTGVGLEFDDGNSWLTVSIFKDGDSVVAPFPIHETWALTWQIPIPEDWESGTYDVIWDVYRPTGITASGSTSVTVPALLSADTTPPVIITDSDMTIFVTNSSKIPVSYATARATDNVGITAQPTCTPSSGSLFSVGTHFVYCIAYDDVGLKGEKSFKITIINTNAQGDNQPPVFTQKQDITTDATISNGATVKFELPTVTDDTAVTSGPTCFADGESIPIVSDESTLEFFFDIGPTTVECIAYDAENNKGATKFTVTVNSQIALPDKIPFDVTLSTNTSDYNTEDAIFVTGISTPFTEKSISINVKDQLNELVHREQLIPKLNNDVPTGTYEGIIFPTILWDTSGNYTMSATYGDATDSVPFTFEYIQTENNNSNIPTGITLNVNATGYAIGDTISVTSQLTGGTSGQSITIDVKNESGYGEILKPLNTDDSGSISYSFKSQDNWKPGKYSITASAVDPNASGDDTALWDWSTSESIQMVKPLPKITIAPTIATTESGDVIASYKAGEIGYFSTSLLSDSTSNVLVTISVLDAEDTTLGVTFFKSVIGKGDSKIVLGFKIPEDAANGAAKIYVNTYTDWPDQGGIPISSELLSEVNIEGITAAAAEAAAAEAAAAEAAAAELAAAELAAAELAAAELAAENMIPKFLSVLDVVQTTSSEDGSIVSYELPIATGGVIPSDTICKPASGSKFIIGSTQVKCEATNDFGTGKTFFMVTVNQQIPDQTLSVKVGNNSYDNEEPIFVIGSVGKVTGGTINLQVTDSLNNLVFMKSITPKELGTYSTIIQSNELWRNPGEYTVFTTYGSATAQDTFEFELIEVESFTAELIPTSLSVDTDNSVYVLGDNVFIDMKLLGAGAGESILLDIRDSQNDQVFLNSLNTDSNGIADISYPLEPTQNSGIYSVIASSNVWNFTSTATFVAVAQIADITIGDVLPTLQDGTEVDSFKIGNLGYFQTPIISNSTSNVLIAVTVFDVENTPLGLAYFESKIVNDAFNITLGLEIPEDAAPGLATVYINTYTDWPDNGGVSILEEQVSFIEIIPSSISDLVVSTNSTLTNSTLTNSTLTNSTLTNSTLTNSTLTNSTLTNSTLTNSTLTNSTDVSP